MYKKTRIKRNLFSFVAIFVKILNWEFMVGTNLIDFRNFGYTTTFTMFLFLYYFFRLQIRMRNIWEWERVTDRDNSHNQKPWILQHNCPHVIWRKNWHVQSWTKCPELWFDARSSIKKTFVHWLFFFCDMISVFLAILIFQI